MKKALCIGFVVLLLMTTLVACNDRGLLGTWVTSGGDGLELRLVFETNDKGYMTAMGGMVKLEFTYSAKSGELKLFYEDDETFTYGYKISQDQLIITNDEGVELIYTKKK